MFVQQLLTALEDRPPVVVGVDPDLTRIQSLYPQWAEEIIATGRLDSSSNSDNALGVARLYREYSLAIVDAVHDLVPAIKPQSAFFEVWGHHGVAVLEEVIHYARRRGLLVITDVKRGDVPSTAEQYAVAYMGLSRGDDKRKGGLSSDALTVNPYLGGDSLEPFFRRSRPDSSPSSGVFVLLKTSNPGSGDLQDLFVVDERNEKKKRLYEHIATLLSKEIEEHHRPKPGEYCNIGAVVGATFPEAARSLRRIIPHSFLVVPGLGFQGGDISRVTDYLNPDGRGALFNFSRSIIYSTPFQKSDDNKNPFDGIRKNISEATLNCIRELQEHLPG